MEVQLSTSPENVHADTFVSMRVGDVQKQSRLSTSRTYHFPATGDGRGRFGRIEVFKRVGDLTVDLSKHDGCEQSVQVPCNIPGMATLSMGLAVKGEPTDAIKEAKAQQGSARGKVKWDAAQKYIAEHSLEDVLADAMREVIRHKPEDPFTFLSEQILAKKSTLAEKPAVVPAIPLRQAQQASASPAPVVGAPAVKQAPPQLGDTQQTAEAPPQLGDTRQALFAHRPSVGSWLAPASPCQAKKQMLKPCVTALTPFSDYYSANMVSYEMTEELIIKFNPFPRPPTPSAPPAAPLAAPPPPPPVVPFPMRPSVGSWLSAKPNFEIIRLKEEAARTKAALREAERKPFHLRPSVGTWLAPRPAQEPEPVSAPLLRSLRTSDMMKMPQDQLISTFQSELARKDKEIEELKATLRSGK